MLINQRYEYLKKQLKAVISYAKQLGGEKLKFVQEAEQLYDVTPHIKSESHFVEVRKKLEDVLGGDPSVPLFQRYPKYNNKEEKSCIFCLFLNTYRYADFRKKFVIPRDRLDAVFQAAILECKKRTASFIKLPQGEDFKVNTTKQTKKKTRKKQQNKTKDD